MSPEDSVRPAIEDTGLAVVIPVFNEPAVTRTLEALLRQEDPRRPHVFLVDNASTDDTVRRVTDFASAHPDLPVSILTEPQKGTGAASDTGFRAAITAGHGIVARTDGDSEPAPDWTARIRENFAARPEIQLLGGSSVPLRDQHYRWGDAALIPVALRLLRVILALQHLNHRYLRAVAGHNMAVRSEAYLSSGGIGRTAIDTRDEDIDFSVRLSRRLGSRALRIDPELTVATSMRRVRRYGLGLMGLHHLAPVLRGRLIRSIDIR